MRTDGEREGARRRARSSGGRRQERRGHRRDSRCVRLVSAGAWLLCTWVSAWGQGWTDTLTVREGQQEARTLVVGYHPDATAGVDRQLGEVEQPPLPPGSTFDLRFVGPQLGNGTLVDIRASGADGPDTLSLSMQRGALQEEVTVSWHAAAFAAGTRSARLQDAFGGMLHIDVDMRATGLLRIESAAITALRIYMEPADSSSRDSLVQWQSWGEVKQDPR